MGQNIVKQNREREKTALGDIKILGITTQLSQFVLAKR